MLYTQYKPRNKRLLPHIEYYNSLVYKPSSKRKFISLPEGKVGMVFLLSGACLVYGNEPSQNSIVNSHIFGLVQEPKFIEIGPHVKTFSVVFKPGSLHYFVPKMPVNEIASSSCLLQDIYGDKLTEMEDLLFECKSDRERVELIERKFLLPLLKPLNKRIERIKCITNRTSSLLKVKDLQKELNISTRQIQHIFNDKIGLSPKQFLRIQRFKKAIHDQPKEVENFAQYATRMGYYDESHFIHEFKLLSGMTPGRYFKNLAFTSDFYNYKRLMLD